MIYTDALIVGLLAREAIVTAVDVEESLIKMTWM